MDDAAAPVVQQPKIFTRWKYPIIILISVIAVYVKTISYDFVNYDDYDLVYQNGEYLSKPKNILTSFANHVFVGKRAESAYYRPILQDSYIADYQLWGLNPLGYHLTNCIFHALTALLVYYFLRKLLMQEWLACLSSLIFALHPVQTEAVAWVAGRNDLLLGMFVVTMLLAYKHYRELPEQRFHYLIFSLVAFTFALFTKEPAIFYLILLPVLDCCAGDSSIKEIFKPSYVVRLLPFVIVSAGYLFVRKLVIGEIVGTEKLYTGTSFSERLLHIPSTIIEHCSLIALPVNLSVVHQANEIAWFFSPWNILATVLLILFLFSIALSWRIDKLLTFGLIWFLVGLLPLANIVPVAVPILEHRLYVPMMAIVLILSRLLVLLQHGKLKRLVVPFAIGAAAVCAVMTFVRLPVWENSESLWLDAIKKSPATTRSYFNLSGYYFDRQQYEKVIPVLEQYIRMEPFDVIALTKLRQTYFFAGKYNDAARVCKQLIAFNPTNPQRYIEAALLYSRLQQPDSAYDMYRQGLLADSTSHLLHFQMAQVCEQLDRLEEAENHYTMALRLNPSFALAYPPAIRLYAKTGQPQEAIQLFEQSLSLGRPSQEFLSLVYPLYIKTKQQERFTNVLQQYGLAVSPQ